MDIEYLKSQIEVAREVQDDIICLKMENKELTEELNLGDSRDPDYINGKIDLNDRLIIQEKREFREMMAEIHFSLENDYDDTGSQFLKIGKRYGHEDRLADIEITEKNVESKDKFAKFALNKKDALNIINYLSVLFEIRQYQKGEI